MKSLLWKDYHVNRVVLIAGAIVLLLPYVVGVLLNLWTGCRFGVWLPWWVVGTGAGLWSLCLSGLTIALLGGNAVAGERADRSAEFLATLPVSRSRIIASKAVLAVGVMLLIWAINLAVVYGPLVCFSGDFGENLRRLDAERLGQLDAARRHIVSYAAALTVCAFGVAWFCSTLYNSPAIAAGSGIAAPIVLYVVFAMAAAHLERRGEDGFESAYFVSCVLLGCVSFIGGFVVYLRRAEER